MLEINTDSNVLSNDEPTSKDSLDRDKYAEAFVRLSETTKGPLVVGLYGTWGSGKTSLMKLIEKKLNAKKAHAIWFNLWEHQFDEHPAVAMAQKLVETLELKNREKAKKTCDDNRCRIGLKAPSVHYRDENLGGVEVGENL